MGYAPKKIEQFIRHAWACVLIGLFALFGNIACMTTSLIYWAGEDHPGFERIAGIEKAWLHDDEALYLVLDEESAGRTSEGPVVLRIKLGDLATRNVSDPSCRADVRERRKVRIKLKPVDEIPAGARPILVTNAMVAPGEQFRYLVESLPAEPQLVVLKYDYSNRSVDDPHHLDRLFGDPALLLVLPSSGVKEVALMTDYKEFPWKRRPWLFLTPVAVAGDIVTFPLQLIAALIMPEC